MSFRKAHGSASFVKTALQSQQSDRRIIVIKIGTSSLINEEHKAINISNLARICETVKSLHSAGHYVILVSSGAIGVGCQRLGLSSRPAKIAQKQALAAVGQVHLMRYYEDFLQALGLTCAQVLLTLDNLADRSQYLNARNTFTELLAYGTIPVVNENDTVAVQELRFGDNDSLSAQVAALVEADWLFLLTDVDALYTANPKLDPEAVPIREVEDISSLCADTSTSGTQWGTGGMVTKLTAARIATAAGTCLVICSSADPEAITRIMDGQPLGTKFHPLDRSLRGRKRWLLTVPMRGQLWLDDGAVAAVRDRRKSLFAAGIVRVLGDFHAQDAVSLCDRHGAEFGRGLCSFSAEEVGRVKGRSSRELQALLGYHAGEEIVHRENLALLAATQQQSEGLPGEEDEWRRRPMKERLQAAAGGDGGGGGSGGDCNSGSGSAGGSTAASRGVSPPPDTLKAAAAEVAAALGAAPV